MKGQRPAPVQTRELVRRPTALADAMLTMLARQGVDVSNAKVPLKREPSWRVSRKG
jgi:hypothetical protein